MFHLWTKKLKYYTESLHFCLLEKLGTPTPHCLVSCLLFGHLRTQRSSLQWWPSLMQKYSSVLPARAPGDVLFPQPWVCVWRAVRAVLLFCRQEQPPHTLPVRKGWLLELTDPSQVQTGQSCLHGFYFLAPLELPSTSLHRKPLGSLDLEFSTPSQIFLICKSVCYCIPMQRYTQKSLICAETSDVGSGHLQWSICSNIELCTCSLSVSGIVWCSSPLPPLSGSLPAYWPHA